VRVFVTKADIVERIAAGTGLTKLETEAVVNGFIHTVKDAMMRNERVDLRGFGCFLVQERAPRAARNPRTNEPVPVPATRIPSFKPSKEFRKQVDLRTAGLEGR
jgi:nucleoid DNA-binding protein